ncbi:3-amino-5-hydroxybenzoate synthase [Adhaeribacter aerolatus]|uniref:3-amino-5-hydroxybenzoate synthase n=1 Tax=Adhaeribacter aerolatus TaxID=670289 RepID=A0A512AYI4_9BACT|nr:DegT/DnrJ/EryC1/StrS family aminotransferase [Adhaeribacter aerolatus]GEO04770.1 3-amino-5-hydroxybenzoate synthase [Adhaeribacter aerolatus]
MENKLDRRDFISALSLAGVSLAMGMPHLATATAANAKPALLGGPKAHPGAFPSWPLFDQSEEKALLDVLRSKVWGRLGGKVVATFEKEYQQLLGAKHCLGVSSGTSALYTILGALEIGPGDEVIIPPYTFIATYNVVVLNYALPVFVDTDIESFQIDANKIENAVTPQTKVIMPVHVGGSPANLDKILEVGRRRNIPVVEDACQAHLAEWKGRKVGTYGLAGAFSFQASKNLNSAEGGAISTNDEQFARTCYSFHNQGQGGNATAYNPGSGTRATNLRLTEFQGALLLAQMARVAEQTKRRNENATYLSKLFSEIPGIKPAKLYDGTTSSAYHLYMFRFDKKQFGGLDRAQFLKALSAEGVPCSAGYGQMNKDAYVTGLAQNKHYLRIYGEKTMQQWLERNQCPQNDILSSEQGVWLTQNMLLGSKTDMEQIADAVQKIHKYSRELAKV